jgi:single-strand DNA-binding protein
MSVRLNKVFVAGNLTRDPQVRFLANEKAVASFGIACNRNYKTAEGESREEVTFLDIEAWGRTAEICGQYLTKGKPCLVEGRLKMESWDDKKDGSKRSKIVIVADNVQFLGAPGTRGAAGEGGEDAGYEGGSAASRPAAEPRRPAPRPAPAAAGDDDEPPF